MIEPKTSSTPTLSTPRVSGKPILPKGETKITPEGYMKNAFGEIVKKPSNKTGGFIRNPFVKIEPKKAPDIDS